MISQHMGTLGKSMDLWSSVYENVIFFGDFNTDKEHLTLKAFCNLYSLTSLQYLKTIKIDLYWLHSKKSPKVFLAYQCYWETFVSLSQNGGYYNENYFSQS